MDRFTIRGEDGFITVSVTEQLGVSRTDCDDGISLKGTVEIQQSNFRASGEILYTTAEVEKFFQELKRCDDTLEGEAVFTPLGESLEVPVQLHQVSGYYREHPSSVTELRFEFPCDQSYFKGTLTEIKDFLHLYRT